jgi:hypothetical protein
MSKLRQKLRFYLKSTIPWILTSMTLIILVLISTDGQCQSTPIDQPDSDFKSYLDDGYLTGLNNAITINTLAPLSGYFGLAYERKLTSRWSVKVSKSIKLFKGAELVFGPTFTKRGKFVDGGDFSAAVKYNYLDMAITRGLYQNFAYRKRIGNYSNSDWIIESLYTTVGEQHLIGKRISAGVAFGFGVNKQTFTIHKPGFAVEQPKTEFDVHMVFEYNLSLYF